MLIPFFSVLPFSMTQSYGLLSLPAPPSPHPFQMMRDISLVMEQHYASSALPIPSETPSMTLQPVL